MIDATPTISVVVCAYTEDRWGDLAAGVEALTSQTHPPDEVILVVDHNEGLLRRARAAMPGITVVENEGLTGLSDARNTGVRAATGSIVAFLDDDARPDAGWLAAILEEYRDERVVGVGGSAYPLWDVGRRPSWFPPEFDWVVGCSYRGMPPSAAPIRNFLGCNMSFRREAFDAAGTFDTSVGRVGTRPVGGEETEFCIRVTRAMPGRVLLYQPAASVRHRVPASRTTWRYFTARCYAEGISKAIVSRLAGTDTGLASERRHAVVTLPLGAARHLAAGVIRRDVGGAARAGAIVGGLAVTVAGYVVGLGKDRLARRVPGDRPGLGGDAAP